MTKKIAIIGVVLMMCLCVLVGCGNNYNARLYDNANEYIKKEFAAENLTRGSYYGEQDFYADDTYPATRTFIVDNQTKYDEIFIAGLEEFDISFDKQMLIVYTFTTVYHRNNWITSVDVYNSVLTINYKMDEKFGVGDASRPYQRWFVVKLDALNITSVEFVEK